MQKFMKGEDEQTRVKLTVLSELHWQEDSLGVTH